MSAMADAAMAKLEKPETAGTSQCRASPTGGATRATTAGAGAARPGNGEYGALTTRAGGLQGLAEETSRREAGGRSAVLAAKRNKGQPMRKT